MGIEIEAIKAAHRAILANPGEWQSLSVLIGFLMAREALSEALSLTERILRLGAQEAAIFRLRGRLRRDIQSSKCAHRDFMRAYILAPEEPHNLFQYAVTTRWSGDSNLAEQLLHLYCHYCAPSDPLGWGGYFDFLAQRRRRHEGTTPLKRALALAPGNADLWSKMIHAEWQNPSSGFR